MGICLVGGCALAGQPTAQTVRAWTEPVVIPTYPVGPASPVPRFAQTDWRAIYPYTMQDDLSFDRQDATYKAYLLENKYLRIMVLPAIGGRLFAMYDRLSKQDVLYRNSSIKPALIGLRGAWICGGIEWNFPDGHIVTTHEPVSCRLIRNRDGSASIAIGDVERIFRMSWTVILTLRPDRAYVQTRIICQNRTPVRHRFSWWSNAAFEATEQTQMIFPVSKVTGHGGRRLLDWPIRNGRDVSWYTAHAGATSIFRAAGEEDFMIAYDHGRDVGLAQWADRHVMPGRKFWSWGVSDAGRRWASILSDDGRAYIELQSGTPLTQGQWLYIQPHQVRRFLEYWIPISRIGPPARVNPDAAVRLTISKGQATVGVLPTTTLPHARIELSVGDRVVHIWRTTISPERPLVATCPVGQVDPGQIRLRVVDRRGRQIIAHRHGHYASGKVLIQPGQQERRWSGQEPATAEQVVERAERQERRGWLPQAIETLQDGWKRFGEDQRIGLALGIARIKQGLFEQARDLLEPIVAQPTQPGDVGAARYYLALAIARLGNADAAERLWRQVNRVGDFWPAAQIELAQLAVSQARYRQAIEYVGPLLGGDRPHPQACVLACFALRKLGRLDEASRQVEAALAQDPLMLLAQTEQALLSGQPDLHGLSALRDEQRRIEAACWYLAVGEHRIAEELLRPPAGGSASPTALYLRALALERAGRNKEAARLRRRASRMNPRGHMPNRLEELEAFDRAVAANSDDPVAWYLRGLVLFSRNRRDQAVAAWKRAVQLRDDNAFAHRCLAAAIEADEPGAGLADLERAVQLEPSVAGLYADLDEAYQRAGILDKRITILEQAVARLPNRSGLAHRLGQAYFDAGQYGRAISCYRSHRFHVAEGRYELHDHYVMALMGRGLKRLGESDYDAALQDFSAALEYPENMSIGRPANPHGEAMIHYWRAVALSGLGRTGQARQALQQAARPEPLGRRLGPWAIGRLFSAVHQALACQRLGQSERLEQILNRLERAARRFKDHHWEAGHGFALLADGLVAAARGQYDQARRLIDKAQQRSARLVGYSRLARLWLERLKSRPAPGLEPTPTSVTAPAR